MFYVNSLLLMSIFVHLWMSGADSVLLYEESTESTESTALFLCSRFSVLLLCLSLQDCILPQMKRHTCLVRAKANKRFKAC